MMRSRVRAGAPLLFGATSHKSAQWVAVIPGDRLVVVRTALATAYEALSEYELTWKFSFTPPVLAISKP
jgi:hypothetical protein